MILFTHRNTKLHKQDNNKEALHMDTERPQEYISKEKKISTCGILNDLLLFVSEVRISIFILT